MMMATSYMMDKYDAHQFDGNWDGDANSNDDDKDKIYYRDNNDDE